MKKTILVLLLLTFKFSLAQTGWFYQNPLPQAKDIISCTYVNENIVYGVAQGGILLKSTNGGDNWTSRSIINIKTNWHYNVNSIYAADENNLYVLFNVYDYTSAYPYFIKKSTNGGDSWDSTFISNNPYNSINLSKINFINQNTGYCYSTYVSQGGAYKTTNAGASWFEFIIPNTNEELHSITFVNENTGWLSIEHSPNLVYKTTNGGGVWNTYNIGKSFNKPFFLNENTGWIVDDSVYKTTNGGINYFGAGIVPDLIYDYGFFNENSGWAIFYGQMHLTSNSGAAWNLVSNATANSQLVTAKFWNSSTGIAMGEHGFITKTTNGGNNWNRYNVSGVYPNFVSDLYMADENTGWALNNFKIIKTTNSGNTWIKTDTGRTYNSINFLNANAGAALNVNYFTRTTNGGASFTQYDYPGYSFKKVCMPSANTWYISAVVSSVSVMLKSTNAGVNWQQVSSPPTAFSDFFFVDDNTGYYSAYLSIYKTTNGGNNWVQISTQMSTELYFINASTGWNIFNGAIYKTTNSGVNWAQQFYLQYSPVQNVQFINANTGWIVAGQSQDEGSIFKTTNGGSTWNKNINFAVGEMKSVYFINENTGWASGYGGTILKTVTGGVGVKQISSSIPDKFYLEQNYPNPFNPVTNIEFSIPQKSFVKLKVFDLLGREIANLVNENLSAGSYKYDFNASALPSGIYFYKLETENFSETRKMVLIK